MGFVRMGEAEVGARLVDESCLVAGSAGWSVAVSDGIGAWRGELACDEPSVGRGGT